MDLVAAKKKNFFQKINQNKGGISKVEGKNITARHNNIDNTGLRSESN